jgi:hypothetical protein
MTDKKPTKRDISKILGRRVGGWNDKRKDHNRIKLTEQLTFNEMNKLDIELITMFPNFSFAIGDVLWKVTPRSKHIVTAIRFWKKN